MDIKANIRKHKSSFNRMSKNSEIMFSDYLKNGDLTEIEFLYELGLNKELIKEYNFNEIQELISQVILKEEFPIITFRYDKETDKKDDLTINNTSNNNLLVISDNAIKFFSNDTSEYLNYTYYILVDNIIRKVNFEVQDIKEEDSKYSNDGFVINATETLYNTSGEIIKEGKFDVKINGRICTVYSSAILRLLTSDSIYNLYYYLEQIINQDKLNEKDIELNLNVSKSLQQ